MADAADLDAGAIVLERVLEPALDRPVGAVLDHVDEVDHDQAREIAQAKLARDFVGGFEVGLERRVLDIVLLGGAARVHVDRDERFGRVDDEVAAGGQGDLRREHLVELALDVELGEQRLIVLVRAARSWRGSA